MALLLLLSVLAAWLSRTPLMLSLEVALLWVVALWVYPQTLYRLWLSRAGTLATAS